MTTATLTISQKCSTCLGSTYLRFVPDLKPAPDQSALGTFVSAVLIETSMVQHRGRLSPRDSCYYCSQETATMQLTNKSIGCLLRWSS